MTQATPIFTADLTEEQDHFPQTEFDELSETRDFSQNHVSLTLSWSLMNQLRSMARNEGISVETLLVELTAEGVAKRVFEDQNKVVPSHLMTRNGYVHDNDQAMAQPQMSHHAAMNGNRANGNVSGNRNNNGNKYPFQQRNGNYNNNRNYQGNGSRSNQGHFRSNNNANGNTYQGNGQQRFSRNNGNGAHSMTDEAPHYHSKENKR